MVELSDVKMRVIIVGQNSLKNNLYLFTFALFAQIYELYYKHRNQHCLQKSVNFMQMLIYGNAVMFCINVGANAYIICKKHFARTEFLMLYFINFLWFSLLFVLSTVLFANRNIFSKCESYYMTEIFTIAQVVKNQIEIISIMCLPIGISGKQFPQNSNILFAFLFSFVVMRQHPCSICNLNLIKFIIGVHLTYCLIGFILSLLSHIKRIKKQVIKGYGFFACIINVILVVVWVILWTDLHNIKLDKTNQCQQLYIIQVTYVSIWPVSLVIMVLIAWVTHYKNTNEIKNINQLDVEYIQHIQLEEDNSYVSRNYEPDQDNNAQFDNDNIINDKVYGTFDK